MNNEEVNKLNSNGNLNYLFRLASDYRKSKFFIDLMRFCSKLRNLKPYNAMLVYFQKPGSQYVLWPEEWKEYGRILKPNAHPLVVLNFQPVGFVYDISDTMPDPDAEDSVEEEKFLNEIANQFSVVSMKENCIDLDVLFRNLNVNGIAVDSQMNAGASLSAQIELLEYPIQQEIDVKKGLTIKYPLPYLISLNKYASKGETIASIFHELGHLFCCHLPFPNEWTDIKNVLHSKLQFFFEPWKIRHISYEAKEIEAEAVAWLVCSHLGIVTKSETYICHLLKDNDSIPDDLDVNTIYKAANQVLEFATRINYKDTLLYHYDPNYKKLVKD